MKKIIVLGILTLMLAPLSAQKHYERKYENSNQLSVQGTLNNAGRRTGSWTCQRQNLPGRFLRQRRQNRHLDALL